MTKKLEIVPEILPVLMLEAKTCWATSIEIITKSKLKQKELLAGLKEIYGEKVTLMPRKENNYKIIFEKLNENCNQFRLNKFPDKEFIYKNIINDTPILFGGIIHPFVFRNKHSFVVVGCKEDINEDSNIFWILTFDPIRKSETIKIAWIYDEIVQFHNYSNNKNQTIDIVTYTPNQNSQNEDIVLYNLLRPNNYDFAKNLKKLELIIRNIQESKARLLTDFFGFDEKINFTPIAEVVFIEKMTRYTSLNKLTTDNNSKMYYLYPICSENVIVLEFIFYEFEKNKFKVLGIKEVNANNILSVNFKGETYPLEHEYRNYEIILINEYKFIRLKNKDIISPLKRINNFKPGIGYNLNSINF